MDLNGTTWEQIVRQAQAAQQAALADEASRRGESALGQNNFLIDWNGSKAMLNLPTAPTTSWNGEEDSNYDRWANANISFSDPTDDGYGFRLMRNPDGTVAQERYKDVADIGFAGDMLKFGGVAAGMYGIQNALLGSAGSSGASGLAGSSASGAGEMGIADTIAGAVGSAGAPAYVLPGYEAAAAAGLSAAGAGGGGAMFDGLLGKVVDFGTSKLGSSLIGAGVSALGSKNAPNSTTQTTTQQIDPRMANILYGSNGDNGFLSQILGNMNKPQNPNLAAFGMGMDAYLGRDAGNDFLKSQAAAQGLQSSNIAAPTMGAASAQAAQVNAPSQNNLNLSPAYQDMIYGQAGNNPYLTGAIQKGINQSNNAFGNYVMDSTKAVQDQLGGIRGGAVLNNTMGSSRQGIAEGRALSDFGQNLTRAASQFGQNNTDAAVAAQAGAYDQDRNRALSAMSGLGAQQYGVAQQNAAMQQQTALANAGFQQQANQANLGSQLSTNQLNSQNQTAGIGLSSGLLGQAAGYGQQQDQYAGNKLGQTAGLLSPFTGYGATQSQTTPLYQNTAGNILGGAMAGASLWNAFNKS